MKKTLHELILFSHLSLQADMEFKKENEKYQFQNQKLELTISLFIELAPDMSKANTFKLLG